MNVFFRQWNYKALNILLSCLFPFYVVKFVLDCPLLLSQFIDEDCTLEEEEDGPVEDEDEIDQYNDDTFGAGAIGEVC